MYYGRVVVEGDLLALLEKGNTQQAKDIIHKFPATLLDVRSSILPYMAIYGHDKLLEEVIASSNISAKEKITTQLRNNDFIGLVLTQLHTASIDSIGTILSKASKIGYDKLVSELLNEFPNIRLHMKFVSFKEAFFNGHKNTALILLNDLVTNIQDYWINEQLETLELAAHMGNSNLVRQLLSEISTEENTKAERALLGAAKGGHIELLKELLARFPNTGSEAKVLVEAAIANQFRLVEELLVMPSSHSESNESDNSAILFKCTEVSAAQMSQLLCRRGNNSRLIQLLLNRFPIMEGDNEVIKGVIANSAMNGLDKLLWEWIERLPTLKQEQDTQENQDIFYVAGLGGHENIIVALQEKFPKTGSCHIFEGAVHGGHKDLALSFLNNVTPEDKERACNDALENGEVEVLVAILRASPDISIKYKLELLAREPLPSHEELLKVLLDSLKPIDPIKLSPNDISVVIKRAATIGDKELLSQLIASHPDVEEGLIAAAQSGREDLVQNLWSEFPDISIEKRGDALVFLVNSGYVDLVRQIGVESWFNGHLLIERASSHGNNDEVLGSFQGSDISSNDKVRVLEKIVENGAVDSVMVILSNYPHYKHIALSAGKKHNQEALVEKLCEKFPGIEHEEVDVLVDHPPERQLYLGLEYANLSPGHRGKILYSIVSYEQTVDLASVLFQDPTISPADKRSAVCSAATNGNFPLVKSMIETCGMDKVSYAQEALKVAANNEQIDLVLGLIKTYP